MSKHRREDDTWEPKIEDRNLTLTVSRLKAKVTQGVKILYEALKLARGFERQKLGRRQKNASSDPQTLLRLREEVIVLRQLQLEKTARTRLLKSLCKTKRIKKHTAFTKAYGSDPTLEHVIPGAHANVVGRLFSSAPVKQALADVMKSIYHVLKISPSVPNKFGATDPLSDEPSQQRATARTDNELEPAEGEQVSRSESGNSEILSYARGRLASSDEDSDNDEVELPDISVLIGDKMSSSNARPDNRETLSPSPSLSDASDSGGNEPPDARQPIRDANRTAFLPSLSMGGYYSGSESEDDTSQHHGPALPKPRNNRRGQQARQRLAELKYGTSAKHLAKPKAQNDRSSGWDLKRGAVNQAGNGDTRSRNRTSSQKSARDDPATRSKQISTRDIPKDRDDKGPIHPSWEAAKRRKMQDQNQAAFQGKKITFE